MFQGFGKVDLPNLKWRSGRCDNNARAMGGVLAAWRVAVKREPALLAAGRWPLAASFGSVITGETALGALRLTQPDQSWEHFA